MFECEFRVKSFEIIGNIYECQGKVAGSGRENFVESVTGQHLLSRTNSDVQGLDLIHQNLRKLPENLHQIFPNLVRIRVAHSNLQSLTAKDLLHFKDLRVLDVWNNKLHSLPADLFNSTPKIQRVSFEKNPIQRVGGGIFDGLVNLQFVDLRDTHCIDFRAKSEQKIKELKQKLLTRCPSEVESSDSPAGNSDESPDTKDVAGELDELRKHFFLQSQTIISMANEVIEHNKTLHLQTENFSSFVAEARMLIEIVTEIATEQDAAMDDLVDAMREQDEYIDELEERLALIEKRLGMKSSGS
jgi:hypothetical protein